MNKEVDIWKDSKMISRYLDTIRGGIPLAEIQLDIMMRLIAKFSNNVSTFLDLGCGDGILGNIILSKYPDANGVFVDFSQQFLDSAKEKLAEYKNCSFYNLDYSDSSWFGPLEIHSPYNVIVSGFSIHHQPDEIKKRLYQDVYGLLNDGGLFVHSEHVSSHSPAHEDLYEEYFIDSICLAKEKKGEVVNRANEAESFYNRADKASNILAPIEDQCDWLRDIGFKNVDIPLKIFELGIFCGTK